MKVFTPEISWHQKEPIFSVDFCPGTWRLATAGADFTIKIWSVKEDAEGNVGLDFLANLDRHSKPVNCVRFSPDGKYLASAGDDCIIIIWKLSEDEEDMPPEPSFGSEDIVNMEKWTVHKMLRRGHLEDIYDLAWSPDGKQLISGSVDNSAIIWDISKGHFTNIIKDHKHYVQGVCWDPRGQYVVTHSSDRTCRVYSLSKNRCVQTIHKASFPVATPTEEGQNNKTVKMFMDETMQSFFRRCQFSPDGLLLVLPGGVYSAGEKPVKATYVFARGNFSKPALCLPGSKKPSVCSCFCPVAFDNMTSGEASDGDKENEPGGIFKLPYRMCYAVATLDSVVFYDTQHQYPFGFVSNVHYASLTDMAWSSDGRILVVSSLDGYCSIVSFKDGELGKPSDINPSEYVSNKLKAKREAKKKAIKVEVEAKKPVPENEKEPVGGVLQRAATQGKDQPTLFQCITPARKRKRPAKSPQSSLSSTSAVVGGSPDASHGLICKSTGEESKIPPLSSPLASTMTPREGTPTAGTPTPGASSDDRDKKTPKRANLISLGFKRIPKPATNSASKDTSFETTKETPTSEQQPRRITFVTLQGDREGKPPQCDAKRIEDPILISTKVSPKKTRTEASQGKTDENKSRGACDSPPQVKPARRVALLSVPLKRDHSGGVKEGVKEVSTSTNIANDTKNAPPEGISVEKVIEISKDQNLKSVQRVTDVAVMDKKSIVVAHKDPAKTSDSKQAALKKVNKEETAPELKIATNEGLDGNAKSPVLIVIDDDSHDSSAKEQSIAKKESNGNAQGDPTVNFAKEGETINNTTSMDAVQANSSPGGKAPRRVELLSLK